MQKYVISSVRNVLNDMEAGVVHNEPPEILRVKALSCGAQLRAAFPGDEQIDEIRKTLDKLEDARATPQSADNALTNLNEQINNLFSNGYTGSSPSAGSGSGSNPNGYGHDEEPN